MSIKRVSLAEASGHLAELIEAAQRGDDVVIEAEGQMPVRLVLAAPEPSRRELGVYRGKIRMHEGFNEPLSEEAWLSGHP